MFFSISKGDITPLKPINLGGYGTRNHPFEGVHDQLECNAMWWVVEGEKILFVCLDVINVDRVFCDELRAKIMESIDIKPENIIISAIHSHSSPMVYAQPFYAVEMDEEYRAFVLERAAEISASGIETLQEVVVMGSVVEVEGYYGNRNDLNKPGDQYFYLFEYYSEGKRIGASANISCHATVVGPDNYLVSSDLIGAVRRELEESLGVKVCVTVGNAGDMSNRQFRQGNDFSELNRIGAGIVKQVLQKHNPVELRMAPYTNTAFSYPIEYKMDQNEVQRRLDNYEERIKTVTDYDERKLVLAGIAAFKRKQQYDHVSFNIDCQLIRCGDLEIITMPGELVSKFGLMLKNNSKSKVCMVLGYTNDAIGYIVEEEEYGKNHESNASLIPLGEPEKMIEALIDLQSRTAV